jgi:hypothetical protein
MKHSLQVKCYQAVMRAEEVQILSERAKKLCCAYIAYYV